MHYEFSKDIKDGEEGEVRVAEMICSKCDGICSVEHNDDIRYDWKFGLDDGNSITVEVKNDKMIDKTRNFAFEVECRHKPSGVIATQSDLFVVYCNVDDNEHAYAFKTDFLKRICESGAYKTVQGGDKDGYGNPTTKMVLVPKDRVIKSAADIAERESIDLRKFASECKKV